MIQGPHALKLRRKSSQGRDYFTLTLPSPVEGEG